MEVQDVIRRPSKSALLTSPLSLLAAWCLVVLAGCSSPAQKPVGAAEDAAVRSALYQQYEEWRGVPYRLGGASKGGIDCSALVQITYRDLFAIDLPRETGDLARVAPPVSAKELRSGDLVFFKTALWSSHVGIYLADGKFMHASASRGVIISDLANPYWRKHYWKSLRPLASKVASR